MSLRIFYFVSVCLLSFILLNLVLTTSLLETRAQVTYPPISYQYSPYYQAAAPTGAIVTGEFNGDGLPDVATANINSTSYITIFLNDGEGAFRPPINLIGPNPMSALVTADFNNDGIDDLAMSTGKIGYAYATTVLLGNREEDFYRLKFSDLDYSPRTLVAGDINNDGYMDLVGTLVTGDPVGLRVLLGNGDGTFYLSGNFGTRFVTSLALGDINRDGKADIVASYAPVNPQTNCQVTIFIGNGTGSFQETTSYLLTSNPFDFSYMLVLQDLNRDGKVDIISTNNAQEDITILPGNGDGTFASALHYGDGFNNNSMPVIVKDFNHDGVPDIVTRDQPGALGILAIRFGNGDNTFQSPIEYEMGGHFAGVTAIDFNQDANLDLVTTGAAGISLMVGKGDGTFLVPRTFKVGSNPESGLSGDFNKDGKLDIITINTGSNNLSFLAGNGDGTFMTKTEFGVGNAPMDIVSADFNRDGNTDLAVANSLDNTIGLLVGNGNGTFQTAVNYSTPTRPQALTTGDFNRDGNIDLAVANGGSNSSSIFIGVGDATFQLPVSYAVGINPSSLSSGDFNRDGLLDVVVTGYGGNFGATPVAGSISILLGNGNGTFQTERRFTTGNSPRSVAVSDMNNDGKLDLVIGYESYDGIGILPGNGDGTFGSYSKVTFMDSHSLTVRDLDGDSYPEILSAEGNIGGGFLNLFVNTGNYTFQPVQTYNIGQTYLTGVLLGDFNQDNRNDIAYISPGESNLAGFVNVMLASLKPLKTKTGIGSSTNPVFEGFYTFIIGSVTSSTGLTASGIVNFWEGETLLGSIVLGNGGGSITINSMTGGAHYLRAEYLGDKTFAKSTSTILVQDWINPATVASATDNGTGNVPGTFSYSLKKALERSPKTVYFTSNISEVKISNINPIEIKAGITIQGRCTAAGPQISLSGAKLALNEGNVTLFGLKLKNGISINKNSGSPTNKLNCVKVELRP